METEDIAVLTEWNNSPILVKALSILVAVLMFLMMGLTFADVVGRYGFGQPIPGGFEIIEFVMGTMIFSAIPVVSHYNSHINVGLFDHAFKGNVRRVQQTFVLMFSTVTIGFMGWRLWDEAMRDHLSGKVGQQLDVPVAPVIFGMAGLSFLACLLLVLLTVNYLRTGIEPVASGSLD